MASNMGWWCGLWFCFIGLSTAEVLLNGQWKENSGFEVTCAWQTWINDSLQSVSMYRNDYQYVIYRPQRSGQRFSQVIPSQDFTMTIKCQLASAQGQRGTCTTKVDLYNDAAEDTYKCEVSGEGPQFRQENRTYTVFVPPSNAVVTSVKMAPEDQEHRPILNCTSSGLPAPRLLWSVNGHMVPSDFSHTEWNRQTKLWHSWSSLNPQEDHVTVTCTPEVTTRSGIVERGKSIDYDGSGASWTGVSKMILVLTLIVTFLR